MTAQIRNWLSASFSNPILLIYGVILSGKDILGEFQHHFPYIGHWGEKTTGSEPIVTPCGKTTIKLLWYSIVENQFFQYEKEFEISAQNNAEILWGIKSGGEISCWEFSDQISQSIGFDKAECVTDSILQLMGDNPIIVKLLDSEFESFESLQNQYLSFWDKQYRCKYIDGFPDNLETAIKKYQYRFQCDIYFDEINVLDYILNVRFIDGSFDKRPSNDLLNLKRRPVPYIINIQYTIEHNEYNLIFFLIFDRLTPIFSRFYGAHPETKADFIIRIDPENRKYELALYRQGLKEPVIIPQSAYQLIVFKNKFEDYRSENYDQPRGAWIW